MLAVVVMSLLFASVVPLRTYLEQRSRLAGLDRQIAVLSEQNAKLRRQISLLHDPDHLERIARECLGMVRRGEIGFVIVRRGGLSPRANC